MRLSTRRGESEGASNIRKTREGYRNIQEVILRERNCNDNGLQRMRDKGTGLCREIHMFDLNKL